MRPARRIDRSSTTERVADALRELLYAGELAPGDALREVALAESFGVARSTLREALALLATEGLVRRYPNRGVLVAEASEEDLADVYTARLVLESAGVRAAAPGPSLDALDEAMRTYAEAARRADEASADRGATVGARQRVTEAHLAFHNALVGLTGSPRLNAVAQGLAGELRLALATVERRRQNTRSQLADHRRLLRLVREGRTEAALDELARHLDRARRSVTREVAGG